MSDDKPAAGADEPTAEHATVPAAPAPPAAEQPVQQPGPTKQRFVDRVWGLKAIIAVGLASVIIGGLGGAALAKGGEGQGGNDRFGHGHGFGPGFGRGPNGQGPPGQMNGQMNGHKNGQMPGQFQQGQQGGGSGQSSNGNQG